MFTFDGANITFFQAVIYFGCRLRGSSGETLGKYDDSMPDSKGSHIRSITMKNFAVWIILISTAALGVAVAQPNGEEFAHAAQTRHIHQA